MKSILVAAKNEVLIYCVTNCLKDVEKIKLQFENCFGQFDREQRVKIIKKQDEEKECAV